MSHAHSKLKAHGFKTMHEQIERCLAPGLKCENKTIRAHSVQNAQALELLAMDGQLKRIHVKFLKGVPTLTIDSIGRNVATTFFGLCSKHDADIFRTIDTEKFDECSKIHLFLYAYRSVLREYHAKLSAASTIQSTYLKKVELGLDPGNKPTEACILATQNLLTAHLTHKYKECFDKALTTKAYDLLVHDIIWLDTESPTIAASSLFSVDEFSDGNDCPRVILNVFPVETNKTIAVFSYTTHDATRARTYLSNILHSTDKTQQYLLSKTILNSCENFVISPRYFASWNREKTKAITDYFSKTLFKSDLSQDNPDFILF